jgi:hypothetical protein
MKGAYSLGSETMHLLRFTESDQYSVLTTDFTPGVRFPAETKDFSSSLCVQTNSEAHSASYPMGTGSPFPGAKFGRGVTLTTNPIYFRGQEWVGAIPPLPLRCLGGVVVSVLATRPKGPSSRMGSKAGRSHVVRFYGM